jgi:hypothetical protein
MARRAIAEIDGGQAEAARERLADAEAEYRRAWQDEQRASALDAVRRSVPRLECSIANGRKEISEWESHLADLQKARAAFVDELMNLPDGAELARLTAQEDDRARLRRQELSRAIAALDGAEARGTLVDHLWNQPRIPGTLRRIKDAREQVAKAERDLEGARRQLASA